MTEQNDNLNTTRESLRQLKVSSTRKNTARLREIHDEIEDTLTAGATLKDVYQTLLQHQFSFSFDTFYVLLQRIRKQPPATKPVHKTESNKAKSPLTTNPAQPAKKSPIPDFDDTGMTLRQRSEAIADYYVKNTNTEHPLIRKALERKRNENSGS